MGRLEDLARSVVEGRTAPPSDEETEAAAPFLWEFLTLDHWSDGSERLLPRIVIDRCGGGYKVTLQDDALCVKKSVTIRKLGELVTALERVLCDSEQPFESYKSFRNKKGPKVPEKEKRASRKRS